MIAQNLSARFEIFSSCCVEADLLSNLTVVHRSASYTAAYAKLAVRSEGAESLHICSFCGDEKLMRNLAPHFFARS